MGCVCWSSVSGRAASPKRERILLSGSRMSRRALNCASAYGHEPARFAEFRRRYEAELTTEPARSALTRLRELVEREHVTLVFAAHEPKLSNAAVLLGLLRGNE